MMNDSPNTVEDSGEQSQALTASASASIIGRLKERAKIARTKDGRAYANATVIGNGKPGQPRSWRVLAFSDETRDELAAADDNGIVSVQGVLDLSIWEKENGERQVSATVIASRLMRMELTPVKRDHTSSRVSPKPAAPSIDDDGPF
jgi:hypothetical protein